MLNAHQAIPMRGLRPTESDSLPQYPNGKGRANRGPTVWMQYVDPSPGALLQTLHRTPPGLASHHRSTAQEIRHRMTSYNRALEITGCESLVANLRPRRLLWTRVLIRRSYGRLPKGNVFGNLEDLVPRGRVGNEKEWIGCVQSDVWEFGIAGDWKAMVSEAEVWVEMVTE